MNGFNTLLFCRPGTGKTLTGVHIAYWFARRNREFGPIPTSPRKDDDSDDEIESAPDASPQVIYCGPSNKSVDVVVSE